MNALSICEAEAVRYQLEYESTKIAAARRCVSEHTQHNQIKAAMAKMGVHTQIGLLKEFYRHLYGIRYSLRDGTRRIAMALMLVFLIGLGNVNQVMRRARRVRREGSVIEYVI